MDLVYTIPDPARIAVGRQIDIVVPAGKPVEFAYWAPGKITFFNETVPAGKQWTLQVSVRVIEEDV